MGTYFPPLNLTLDADERAVKRAYAAALKITRPEDDPAGFQALVEARDRALAWVRRRSETVALSPAIEALRSSASRPGPATPDVTADTALHLRPDAAPVTSEAATGAAAPDSRAESDDDALVAADVTAEDAHRVLREILAAIDETPPLPLPPSMEAIEEPPILATSVPVGTPRGRSQTRIALGDAAVRFIREEARGLTDHPAAEWDRLLADIDDLDLAGRLSLERLVVTEFDATLAAQALDMADPAARFAATLLRLDRAFRWSDDMRRLVRILGEPSGTHPLVFAIERFGERAVRLRFSASGFPQLPESDLTAWFGGGKHAAVRAYRKAEARDRFGFGWSWHAFLSPPSFCIAIGANVTGLALTAAGLLAIFLYFDPIRDDWTANGFSTFLVMLFCLRAAFAVAARPLEIASLVSRVTHVERSGLPPPADRRRLIAAGRGPTILNVLTGLVFLTLVDGYWLSLVIPALGLPERAVTEMIVVPDRKTPGATFSDRLTLQSYLDQSHEIAGSIADLIREERTSTGNAFGLARLQALRQAFEARIRQVPIGDYAPDFDRFRAEIAEIKRRRNALATP